MPTANQVLQDASIRHAVYLARYKGGLIKRMIDLLAVADADLVRLLRSRNVKTPYREERLVKLLKAVREQQHRLWTKYYAALRGELNSLAVYEADFTVRSLTAAIPSEVIGAVGIVAPTSKMLYAAVTSQPMQGRFLKDWARGLEADRLRRVEDAIRIGLVEGDALDDIVRRVRGTRALNYRNGVLAINRRNAEAIVRTAVNHVSTRARALVYHENKGLVKAYRYCATLDDRTTEICASLDGKTFKVGDGPEPPQHIRCRSTTAPILASFKELGLKRDEIPGGARASMNGQVPATETYGSWLKKQPAAIQNDVLGKTKAQLFRQGNLKIERFVDRKSGHVFSLKELAKREGRAFRAAGLDPGDFG